MKKFNLSLDDMSPHKKAGLNFESIKWCDRLIEDYPDIKINLFVPAAYARLGDSPAFLSNFPDWVERVESFPDNYSIGLHGMFHRRKTSDHGFHNKRAPSNNDEFQFLDEHQTQTILDEIIKEFNKAGLYFDKVFRPPGWKISISAAKILTKNGFVIAGDDKYYGLLKKHVPQMEWVSYNWDLTGSCEPKGDIAAYGHTSEWTNNYFNKERYELIARALDKERFDFRFIEEMK